VAGLFREHHDDLGRFLTEDGKGRQIPAFLEALAEQLAIEQAAMERELRGLAQNVEHIKEIVALQQSYSKVSGALETLCAKQLVDDALRMAGAVLTRHHIEVVREFDAVPPVLADRHKTLQILVNLVTNAKQALEQRPDGRRVLVRITRSSESRVRFEVTDNGAGVAKENLARIFSHGFTTKRHGHGYGLHSGANAAKEMGGSLQVRSDGLGLGATFVLELPIGVDARDGEATEDDDTAGGEKRHAA
jgi:C4-dicarboxylate-specific signal transduction histidine kinase